MKKRVILSTYAMILPLVIIAIFVGLICWQAYKDEVAFVCVASGTLCFICLMSLLFSPLSVSLSDKTLFINRSLRIKQIPLSEIKSVTLCSPTMSERRIWGSGGFFGYWGRFYEPSIGKYFAYYGKASDCFLVTLKDGKKYMLGCEDAPEMVEAINAALRQNH